MDQPDRSDITPSVPPASIWLRGAVRARFVLLGVYLILSAVWYWAFFSITDPLGFSFQPTSAIRVPFVLGTLVLVGTQALLLLGAPHLHWPRPRRRRSIFVSLAAGSAIAVMLSIGIVLAGSSLYRLAFDPAWFKVSWSAVTVSPTTVPAPAPAPPAFDWRSDVPWLFIGIVAAAWIFWFLIFALVGGGQWTRRFGRMYRTLIGGTILELLITIPIDVQVRRRTNCYCGEGTFFSLAIGLTAILWAFGPGVAILFLVRRQQRLADTGRCLQCGYNLRGLEQPRCPECGTPFQLTRLQSQ
jgi:hypothetical protein